MEIIILQDRAILCELAQSSSLFLIHLRQRGKGLITSRKHAFGHEQTQK